MGAPPQQSDWHLFAVLGISSSAFKQGETKTSPGCYNTRHAVLQSVKLSGFGFERFDQPVSGKIFLRASVMFAS